MENLEQRIQAIEARNERVEMDKAWETSFARRALLFMFTYIIIGTYFWAIGVARPWLNAIVPAIGFIISTLAMPFFKKIWVARRNKKAVQKTL